MAWDMTDRLRRDEQEKLIDIIEERGVGLVAAELRVHYHDVADAAFGEEVDEELVDGVRRLLAR
jgi:hypothetical protein